MQFCILYLDTLGTRLIMHLLMMKLVVLHYFEREREIQRIWWANVTKFEVNVDLCNSQLPLCMKQREAAARLKCILHVGVSLMTLENNIAKTLLLLLACCCCLGCSVRWRKVAQDTNWNIKVDSLVP